MVHLPLYYYIILLAFFAGLIRYRRLSPPFMRMMVPFLLLTFLAEAVPKFKLIHFGGNNHWWYNIFTTIEFVFYTFFFAQAFIHPKTKKLLLLAIPVYLIIVIADMAFIESVFRFPTFSYRIGAVMVTVWCYLYFKQLLQQAEEMSLLRNPVFWIATGLLFFYLGNFLYISALNYIISHNLDKGGKIYSMLSDILNAFLYSCFLIALLCSSNRKLSSSSL